MTRSLRSAVLLAVLLLGCRAASMPDSSLPPATRVVTLARGFGLAGVFTRISIYQRGARSTGTMIVTSGAANRTAMERAYGCWMRRDGSDEAQRFVCTVPFSRGEPDWMAILARLDGLGIDPLPPAREHPNLLCADGTRWGFRLEYPTDPTRASVSAGSSCGPQFGERRRFEDGIVAVIDEIDAAAEAR